MTLGALSRHCLFDMSAEQPTNADILQAVQTVSERTIKTETAMTYIKWIAVAGFSISIGATTYLDQKQSARLDRIEDAIANQRNTVCQCEETEE